MSPVSQPTAAPAGHLHRQSAGLFIYYYSVFCFISCCPGFVSWTIIISTFQSMISDGLSSNIGSRQPVVLVPLNCTMYPLRFNCIRGCHSAHIQSHLYATYYIYLLFLYLEELPACHRHDFYLLLFIQKGHKGKAIFSSGSPLSPVTDNSRVSQWQQQHPRRGNHLYSVMYSCEYGRRFEI